MQTEPQDVPKPISNWSASIAEWTPPVPETLNEALPHYEILGLLGRGGMGAVYKALQKSLKRIVAIKLMPAGVADDEMRFSERFKNEAYALARLSHPGIVNVYDAGETSGGPLYFVMEHVDGRDLAIEIRERGRIPYGETKSVAIQICEALSYMHGNGVIHRDIKPANILLTAGGRVKVADFGLAKLDETLASRLLTRIGTSMGTVEFMAPETRRPGAVVDHRADLFSLGVMLYQMLTGELPHGIFKLPSQMLPEIDDRFDSIIWKLLEPIPEDRYHSAEEVCADLQLISDKKKADASTDRGPERGPAPAPRLKASTFVLMTGVTAIIGATAFFFVKKPHTRAYASAAPPQAAELPGGPTVGEENLAATLKRLGVEWQDVSAEARLKAAALTDLEVEGNVIRRRSRKGPSVRLPLTPPSWRDYAIRITHVGDAQIDLRYAKEGFYFVLCQSVQTIFRKQPGGISPGEAMMPNRIHSPGFDINQPHELVALVQGDRLRAWLDGRLVGDLRDSSYTEGAGAVMFVPQTELQRVEIADLTGEADGLAMESAGKGTWLSPGDGMWRDGLGEWIAHRNGTGQSTELESGESGQHVVQISWLDMWLPADPAAQSTLNGSIRAKAKGGLFRLSLRTWSVRFGERTLPVCYRAGFEHNTLKIWRLEGEKATVLPGADYTVPGKFDPAAVYELEFRATGSLLELFLDGKRILTAHDPAPVPGRFRFEAGKGVAVESLETRTDLFGDEKRFREAMPPVGFLERAASSPIASVNPVSPRATLWTDWLGPKLTAEDTGIAKGTYGVALLRGTLLRSLEVSGFGDPTPESDGK